MHKAAEAGVIMASDDISWNITVPGMAIWNQNAVKVIKDIATPIFGENLTLLSEPECALIGINISGSSELDFVKDRYSLVVDLGGGTADICVMKETMNADGSKTFDEIKSTFEGKDSTTSEHAGGNDIDRNFKAFFCNYLAEGIDLADSPVLLYTEFLKENPVGAMEFDKKWIELQFSDEIEEDTISFFPGRYYIEWLRTHYPAAANKRGEYGFSLNGEKMREYVFTPVYKIILKSLEENLIVLKQKGFELDAIYHAGGLSLDKRLKKQIKTMISTYFPYAKHKETSDGSVIGAVQRGGNHIAVNKDTLIRRMSRKTYYTEFVTKYPGNMDELRSIIGSQLRHDYDQLGIYLNDDEISNIINRQWSNVAIDYSDGCVPYLTPMCIRFTPVTQVQSFEIKPFKPGHQTGVTVRVFSSDKNFVLFMNSDVQDEGEFSHEFGYNWDKAKLVFDPASNAVEGTALFSLLSENDTKLEEFEIRNVSKRGI